MNEERWAKQVYKAFRDTCQWSREMIKLKTREGMEVHWQELRKKDIKSKLKENVHIEWRDGVETKSTLAWYKGKMKIRREDIYNGDWAGKLLFRA